MILTIWFVQSDRILEDIVCLPHEKGVGPETFRIRRHDSGWSSFSGLSSCYIGYHQVDKVEKILVEEPFNFTFERPLGNM